MLFISTVFLITQAAAVTVTAEEHNGHLVIDVDLGAATNSTEPEPTPAPETPAPGPLPTPAPETPAPEPEQPDSDLPTFYAQPRQGVHRDRSLKNLQKQSWPLLQDLDDCRIKLAHNALQDVSAEFEALYLEYKENWENEGVACRKREKNNRNKTKKCVFWDYKGSRGICKSNYSAPSAEELEGLKAEEEQYIAEVEQDLAACEADLAEQSGPVNNEAFRNDYEKLRRYWTRMGRPCVEDEVYNANALHGCINVDVDGDFQCRL